nr:hypothetical protein [uncultured Pedobacter sp.]
MRTDKKITGVLLTLMLISGIEAHAQLGGLLDKAKEKATKAIEKRMDKNSTSEKSGATINAGNGWPYISTISNLLIPFCLVLLRLKTFI